jgi:hypothetical protein
MSELLFDGMSLTVEVGFSTSGGSGTIPNASNPLSSIVWTDITEFVRSVSTSRGRSTELDDYSAGSAQIVLDNRTRRFDPGYASGPYYGSLTPLRPIRIQVTPSGSTIKDVFFGYVDGWPQAFSNPNDATVTVNASDGFKLLNLITLPSLWETAINAQAPLRWFRMADTTGSFYLADTANGTGNAAQWMSSTGAGVTSTSVSGSALVVGEPATSSSFDGTRFVQAYDPLGVNGVTPMYSAWTVEMWIQTTESATGNYAIWNHGDFIHGGCLGLVVASGNATIVGQFGHRGTSNTMTTKNVQVTVNDGRPHHVSMSYRSDPTLGTAFALRVDGIDTSVDSGFTDTVDQGYFYMTLGSPTLKSATSSNNFPLYFKGSIQDFVVYGDYLSDVVAYDHYAIGAGIYRQGESTDTRIDRILDSAEWPSDGSTLASGQSTVLGAQFTGKTALSALKEVEVAEQGRLFMSKDGKVKFVDRNGLGAGNYVTSQGQFDDLALDDVSHGYTYTDITFIHDDRFIFNDVSAAQPSGTFHRAQDSTSQGQFFRRSLKLDNVQVDTIYFLVNIAESRLSQYKNPTLRIDSLRVNGRREISKQAGLVNFDIGDRIRVLRTLNVGSAINETLIIEGIKQQFTHDSWTIQFNTSPTYNSPFVLDSTLLGVLDTNILGF